MTSHLGVRGHLEAVLASPEFSRTERMRRFLKLVVEHKLSGSLDPLKEFTIAAEVFDRSTDFDPQTDPIVRVEASRLRSRLRDYYAGSGKDALFRIDIPKGGYAASIVEIKPPEPPPRNRRVPVWSAVALAAALIGLAAWGVHEYLYSPRSIAVLPFADLTPNTDHAFFADGLAEEILNELSTIPKLKVIARTSAFSFRSRQASVQEIGERLDVDTVLDGSVRKQGDTYRITTQLIRTSDGTHLWSKTFDRSATDLLALQTEVAREVAALLRAEGRELSERPPPTEAAARAHIHVLRGNYFVSQLNPKAVALAEREFRQALEIDPNSAAAHAGLSMCYRFNVIRAGSRPAEWMPKAKREALRAKELDPSNVSALLSLAEVHARYEWDWESAERNLSRAMELRPGHAGVHALRGLIFGYYGRFDESLAAMQRAAELDPVGVGIAANQAGIYVWAGRYAEAEATGLRSLELAPTAPNPLYTLGMTYLAMGRPEKAAEYLERVVALHPQESMGYPMLACAKAKSDPAAARAMAADLIERRKQSHISELLIASIYVALGEQETALQWLEDGYRNHDPLLVWAKVTPFTKEIRPRPEYQKLLKRIGLDK
jgi:serine/threonine-protein kinase